MGRNQTVTREKAVLSRDDLLDYDHAVAGHEGTMRDSSGLYFIKPCTPAEKQFYDSANTNPDLQSIMPEYHGSLQLTTVAEIPDTLSDVICADAQIKLNDIQEKKPEVWEPGKNKKIKTETGLVLVNQAHGYKKPNILDAKLGKILCGDYAPPAKREKLAATSNRTTHKTHGFRIAGMRVYHGGDDEGKWDEEGYRMYNKQYGESTMNEHTIKQGLRSFIFSSKAGITADMGEAIARAFAEELEEIERVLETQEFRLFSSSLLFVFEGDGEALEDAYIANQDMMDKFDAVQQVPNPRTTLRMDSGIAMCDDDDDDDTDEEETIRPMYSVKLIDFAHAEWKPGQGCDENTLMGVRSLKKLFSDIGNGIE